MNRGAAEPELFLQPDLRTPWKSRPSASSQTFRTRVKKEQGSSPPAEPEGVRMPGPNSAEPVSRWMDGTSDDLQICWLLLRECCSLKRGRGGGGAALQGLGEEDFTLKILRHENDEKQVKLRHWGRRGWSCGGPEGPEPNLKQRLALCWPSSSFSSSSHSCIPSCSFAPFAQTASTRLTDPQERPRTRPSGFHLNPPAQPSSGHLKSRFESVPP